MGTKCTRRSGAGRVSGALRFFQMSAQNSGLIWKAPKLWTRDKIELLLNYRPLQLGRDGREVN